MIQKKRFLGVIVQSMLGHKRFSWLMELTGIKGCWANLSLFESAENFQYAQGEGLITETESETESHSDA